MMHHIVCSDLEGVLVPEIWTGVAAKTGISELGLTTRDISNYDILMKKRLSILKHHGLKINDIQDVIRTLNPFEGAVEFIGWLRSRTQIIILSDTFNLFAGPLMKQLGWPTLFCNSLTIDKDGSIIDYNLRQKDGKKKAVLSLKRLNYNVIALGDSYNDIAMLKEADKGILFRPPENIKNEFQELPVSYSYDELKKIIAKQLNTT